MRVIRRRVLSNTIELLDPATEILGHVALEGVHCTWTESMGYDLTLSSVFDSVAYIEHARHS
jgi:hypothetical protein